MIPQFNKSCATSSPPQSPESGTAVFSRRRILAFSAAWPLAALVTDPASGSAGAAQAADAPLPSRHAQVPGEPPLQVTASVHMVQDVNAIDYAVTNLESVPDTVRISYIDNRTGKESRPVITYLDAGETTTGTLHGGLDRTFQVKACNGNGQCVITPPIAAQQI